MCQRVQGGEFDPQFSSAFLKKVQAPKFFYIIAAYDLYASVVFDMWILLCNAASSQCSPRRFREEENIQSGFILAGHARGEFADVGGV